MTSSSDIADIKTELRRRLAQARRQVHNQVELSEQIQRLVEQTKVYRESRTVLFYVDVRDEVKTRSLLQSHLESEGTTVVPFCDGDHLQLVHLKSFDELSQGAYGILEPSLVIRQSKDRQIVPRSIELALIPGVGFDRSGGRLGHGKGYYDRLLPQLAPQCLKVGLAYSCQVVTEIPVEPHDQRLDAIVTENGITPIAEGIADKL